MSDPDDCPICGARGVPASHEAVLRDASDSDRGAAEALADTGHSFLECSTCDLYWAVVEMEERINAPGGEA